VRRIPQKVVAFLRAISQKLPCRSPALLPVARGAGGDEISRGVIAAFDARLDVIHGQVPRIEDATAVHAAIPVAMEDGAPSCAMPPGVGQLFLAFPLENVP